MILTFDATDGNVKKMAKFNSETYLFSSAKQEIARLVSTHKVFPSQKVLAGNRLRQSKLRTATDSSNPDLGHG